MVDDVGRGVDNGLSALHRLPQGTVGLADVGPEHIAAGTTNGFIARHTGNAFRRAVEGSDSPVGVHREGPLVDRVENRNLPLERFACLHRCTPVFRKLTRQIIVHYTRSQPPTFTLFARFGPASPWSVPRGLSEKLSLGPQERMARDLRRSFHHEGRDSPLARPDQSGIRRSRKCVGR